MALEGIFSKINLFKINSLQTSVFLHNWENSRLSLYETSNLPLKKRKKNIPGENDSHLHFENDSHLH